MEVKDKCGGEVVLKNTIGGWCRYYLIEGKLSNREIVEKVSLRFAAMVSLDRVAWYRSELVEKGMIGGGKMAARQNDTSMSMAQFAEMDEEDEARR